MLGRARPERRPGVVTELLCHGQTVVLQQRVQFLREVWVELKKVNWPQRKEVMGSTAVVILASFIVAFFLGAVDLVLQKVLALVIR